MTLRKADEAIDDEEGMGTTKYAAGETSFGNADNDHLEGRRSVTEMDVNKNEIFIGDDEGNFLTRKEREMFMGAIVLFQFLLVIIQVPSDYVKMKNIFSLHIFLVYVVIWSN